MPQNPHVLLTCGKVQNPLRLPHETTSEPSKVVRACGAFNILTWKCASRHNRANFSTSQLPKVLRSWCDLYILTSKYASRHSCVHFFDATSKRAPTLKCYVHFDWEMCFAPQRCPLFRRNFWTLYILTGKCASRHSGVHFFNVSTSKSVSTLRCLRLLTSTCASRHNGVPFLISHLARWLRTRCFSEPTFRPSGATNHWKNRVFRDFATFSRTCIFFLLALSLLCSSLTLPTSAVRIVGSLTSKLPSMEAPFR